MRESFEEYKSVIESNIINLTYLYDGNVSSSSIKETYDEIISHSQVSPKVIINCIIDIYNVSIYNMMSKSIDYIVPSDIKEVKRNAINHYGSINHYINDLHRDGKMGLNFDPAYRFTSTNGWSMFLPINTLPSNKPFPDYFYELKTDTYLCPNINDSEEEVCIYVTDGAIQSLVYSLQNMEYNIEDIGGLYKHTISYNLYECDFTCYKMIIRDLSKIRDIKINEILNED